MFCLQSFFPFSILKTGDEMKWPELPSDSAAWYSSLSMSSPPREVIDDCLAAFRAHGCRNVGDYLKHYLTIDCEILLAAAGRLFVKFGAIFGFQVVESRRFTICGLTTVASQAYLMRHCRIGNACINDPKVYAIVKHGTIGGLTHVARTVAGKDADYESYYDLAAQVGPECAAGLRTGCNAHVLPEAESEKADYCHCHDINGLYSAAM